MRESFNRVVLVLADYYIADGFLVVPADSLGHTGHRRRDQHRNLQIHGIVRDIHLVMLDCQLNFRGHDIWVLVDGDLVHRGIVLLLLLLLRLLFFLQRHRLVAV